MVSTERHRSLAPSKLKNLAGCGYHFLRPIRSASGSGVCFSWLYVGPVGSGFESCLICCHEVSVLCGGWNGSQPLPEVSVLPPAEQGWAGHGDRIGV